MDHPLFRSLFDDSVEKLPQTVTQLNADVRAALETRFSSVWVEGEITNFHSHSSGHWYFSLTDGESLIKAASFRSSNYRIRFKPFDGLQVRVRGRITTYDKRGEYQLLVESLKPVGEGALTVAFEQIKAKLAAEGLFDQAVKRPLPPFPKRVGIVTSPDGAAMHDILSVLTRRARSVSIVLIATAVQGDSAGEQIAKAIALANKFCDGCSEDQRIDVLIVGRGGGSAEDLWAFNEEEVARAIRGSKIPVISAVGHEIDVTIADMAADLRAPTPSAAAEIVARAETEIVEFLARAETDLVSAMNYRLLIADSGLRSAAMSPVFTEFPLVVKGLAQDVEDALTAVEYAVRDKLEDANEQLKSAAASLAPRNLWLGVAEKGKALSLLEQRQFAASRQLVTRREHILEKAMGRLDALSPLAVLKRGFSITQNEDGEIVRSRHQTFTGDRLTIRLADGSIEAGVLSTDLGE